MPPTVCINHPLNPNTRLTYFSSMMEKIRTSLGMGTKNAPGASEKEKFGSTSSTGSGNPNSTPDEENHTHIVPGESILLGEPHGPDPLGDENTGTAHIKYKTCAWWQTSMLMIAETISLGILSLPSVMGTVGLIPGIILILGMGILASYSGYALYLFKMEYPHVKSMADAFEVMFRSYGNKTKRVAREIGGAGQCFFLIFSMAAHILSWNLAFNRLTDHATCTIVWGVVALFVFWLFDLPRTLKKMSYLSIASFISIFSAVMLTMIAVGIQKPGMGDRKYSLWPQGGLTFQKAFISVSDIVFAYAGHVAFFGFIDEMENPREFPKALALLQIADIIMYIVVALVVYYFAGADVASPAFSSAGMTVSKIAYGLAIPTIIIAGVIYGHVSSTYLFRRIFPHHHEKNTWTAFGIWAGITFALWSLAYIIAESIPDFNNLLALVASLFASWFTYGISGAFWIFINWNRLTSSKTKIFLSGVNIFLIIVGGALCGMGLYTSGYAIRRNAGAGHSWSCGK